MVEKWVGEVAKRSYKDGSRAQLDLVIRDKGAMKPYFNNLHENLSFSLFTKGTASSSLRQSGDREEPHLDQRVKEMPPLIFNIVQVVLNKVPIFD